MSDNAKRTEIVMGMPVSVEILGLKHARKLIIKVFDYFKSVDARYSTYKSDSEISAINRGLLKRQWSDEMRTVLKLSEQTKEETGGYFDIRKPDGSLDPSGLVKGWAVQNVAHTLIKSGVKNFYIEAGGDIYVSGKNSFGEPWKIGVRNPYDMKQIVKTIVISDGGVATSGTYIRGQHIYDPHKSGKSLNDIKSITVIGPTIYDADRYATAAFAMGRNGIKFIENLQGFDGYMIDSDKIATMTSGFERYVI